MKKIYVVSSVVIAGVVAFFVLSDGKKTKCERVNISCTEFNGEGEYFDATLSALDCPNIGLMLLDGGVVGGQFIGCSQTPCKKDCLEVVTRGEFRCAMRPKGKPADSCMRVNHLTKKPYDFGDENVMQPGDWVGDGCVRVPCTQISGIPWNKKGQ